MVIAQVVQQNADAVRGTARQELVVIVSTHVKYQQRVLQPVVAGLASGIHHDLTHGSVQCPANGRQVGFGADKFLQPLGCGDQVLHASQQGFAVNQGQQQTVVRFFKELQMAIERLAPQQLGCQRRRQSGQGAL